MTKQDKVAKVMHEWKQGKLTSHGKIVKDYDQAVAIALSEASLSKYEVGGEMGKFAYGSTEKLKSELANNLRYLQAMNKVIQSNDMPKSYSKDAMLLQVRNEDLVKELKDRNVNIDSILYKEYNKYKTGGEIKKYYDVFYSTKGGGSMVAKNIEASSEEEAKEKLTKQMRASSSFDKPISVIQKYAEGGGIGFIPMDLEEKLMIIAKWGGISIKGVIGILNAMIDSGITDADLTPKPIKNTSFQRERATEKKIQDIWKEIEPKYNGTLKGNQYYSTIKQLVEYSNDDILKRYKPFRKYQYSEGGAITDKSWAKINETLWNKGEIMVIDESKFGGEKVFSVENNLTKDVKEFEDKKEAYKYAIELSSMPSGTKMLYLYKLGYKKEAYEIRKSSKSEISENSTFESFKRVMDKVVDSKNEVYSSKKFAEGGGIGYNKVWSMSFYSTDLANPRKKQSNFIRRDIIEAPSRTKAINIAKKKHNDFGTLISIKEIVKFSKGGGIGEENALMVANNNKQIAHHTEEMESALKDVDHVPAWVVAKVNRSASDLSDATHYLEGTENKYEVGGEILAKFYENEVDNLPISIEYKQKEIKRSYPEQNTYIEYGNDSKGKYAVVKAKGKPKFKVGGSVKNSLEILKMETNSYSMEKYGEPIDEETFMVNGFKKDGEEIKFRFIVAESVSGKDITLTPAQLFDADRANKFEVGGSLEDYKKAESDYEKYGEYLEDAIEEENDSDIIKYHKLMEEAEIRMHRYERKYKEGGMIKGRGSRAKNAYNKEVDLYNWFIVDLDKKEAVSGNEYKEDAIDALSDYDGDKNFKIVSKTQLKKLGIDDPTSEWKYAKGGWLTDHKYVNKSEDYEVRYSKGRKDRSGYKRFEEGGEIESKIEKLKVVANSKMLPENRKEQAKAQIEKLEKELQESKKTKSEEKAEHKAGGSESEDKERISKKYKDSKNYKDSENWLTIQKLYIIEGKADDLIKYESGGIENQPIDKIKKYVEYIYKEVSKLNTPFDSEIYNALEDENAHSLNLTLGLLGFYKNEKDSSEWARKRENYKKIIDVVDEIKSEDKEPKSEKKAENVVKTKVAKSKVEEIRDKVYSFLTPLNFEAKIDDVTNEIIIQPNTRKVGEKRADYFDGMQIIYDAKSDIYEVSEYQAGKNNDELHIYKVTPSLIVALKDLIKGNKRKPIKVISDKVEEKPEPAKKEVKEALKKPTAKKVEVKKVSHKEVLAKVKAKKGKKEYSNAPSKGHKRNESSDRKREALPLGKRISESGNVYYENRLNRGDLDKGSKFREGGEVESNPFKTKRGCW